MKLTVAWPNRSVTTFGLTPGGSGDGPRYVQGPVTVTGSDPYGLDADGDGIGCESWSLLSDRPGGYLKWSASGGWRSGACCGSVLTSKSSLARRSFRSRRRFRHSASLRFRFMDTPSLIEPGFALFQYLAIWATADTVTW